MDDKQSNRGRNQDRAKVAAGQDYEVNYEKRKMNVSSNEVKKSRERGRKLTQKS